MRKSESAKGALVEWRFRATGSETCCEQSQFGIESRAYRPGPYSKRESLSVQFDREVLRSLGR